MTLEAASARVEAMTAPSVGAGFLIVNADDWGRDSHTTRCILDCVKRKAVSAVSAMVFMDDSQRGAALAREHAVDAGLHLNLTEAFTGPCSSTLAEHQRKLAAYLRRPRLSYAVFNPTLTDSFEYVVAAQLEEFHRLFGMPPARVDGHHHAHLCANVLLKRLLPSGTLVRRSFSFEPGQRVLNRTYRRIVDRILKRRYRTVDGLFSLAPTSAPERLERIRSLAVSGVIEVETHPTQADEYAFLMGEDVAYWTRGVRTGSFAMLGWS